ASQIGLDERAHVGDEHEQEDGRMSLQRQSHVLAQAVRDEVEIARARAGTFRLRPLDPVLEAVRVAHALLACQSQPEQVLGRLDEDGHLVAVVLAPWCSPCTVEPTVPRRIVPCSTSSKVVIAGLLSEAPERSRTSARDPRTAALPLSFGGKAGA